MALKQFLQLKQGQRLSPMQIQFIKLLKLNNLDLEQRIKDELEANPSLEEGSEEVFSESLNDEGDEERESEFDSDSMEETNLDEYTQGDDTPDYDGYRNSSKTEKETFFQIKDKTNLIEYLQRQALYKDFDDVEQVIADQIIGNIDEDGYLKRTSDAIVDDIMFTYNISVNETMVNKVLEVIQTFDPKGIGARNLQECLLLQIISHKQKKGYAVANKILNNYFDQFVKKHYDKLKKQLNINESELKEAIQLIVKLNPKPAGGSEYTESSATINCDFELIIEGEEMTLNFNSRNIPELRVSNSYKNMLSGFKENKQSLSKSQKDAAMFVKQKLDSAKWFIDAVKQRQQTLQSTIGAILEYQKEYFLSGDKSQLKPMVLKDIARKIDLDVSTVSRIVSKKYMQTPYGIMLLKELFSEAMTKNSGEKISNIEVKSILKKAIEEENKEKPFTDQKLSELLSEKGYVIARRTVAKYREMLGYPTARLRKEII